MDDRISRFIEEACAPLDGDHVSGSLERSEAILSANPDLAKASIHVAAILGDAGEVGRFVAADKASATAKGGPRNWDPLTHLAFSRYLRLDSARSDGFVSAAMTLLDAGADPNGGWYEPSHNPEPVWESVLYGAAGVAHHEPLTRLLLDRGADPNDDETPYHAPEGYDNGAMQAVVESGRLTEDNLAMMLLRKADWHDREGIAWLLEKGADPNRMFRYHRSAFHNSILSDNSRGIVETFLDHGADPTVVAVLPGDVRTVSGRMSAVAMAAHRGRRDLLELFHDRGFSIELEGIDQVLSACCSGDASAAKRAVRTDPAAMDELRERAGRVMCDFAGNGNAAGIGCLIGLGLNVNSRHREGDGYFDVARDSTPLHVAAWRAHHDAVKFLISAGADVNALDAKGRRPLDLGIKACVDSYWSSQRAPDSIAALLRAGASVHGVRLPTGYDEADKLLADDRPIAR